MKKDALHGEHLIAEEHVKNNQGVRQVLIQRDIYPEELPPEEDIKKLEKKLKKGGEQISEPSAFPARKLNRDVND